MFYFFLFFCHWQKNKMSLAKFLVRENFSKKSGVGFFWDLKIFHRGKFENFVQKSTSEKLKASKNRRWHLEIGVRKP